MVLSLPQGSTPPILDTPYSLSYPYPNPYP